ncbi:Elongator complex protein 2 [Ceratocystis fimbriata CBS 114723]|uniref:Elongator complex protein 2 n=2 Tax=Ceratocystis TaxID=5157 RepID=A0A2C5X8M9_9PEZI|nr:Elongator complex protein 2 [Ceratocystis fimbriata CBS 114723]
MSPFQITTEYISTGANRHTAVADWSSQGTLAFGADVNIALWEPNSSVPRGVSTLLRGHKETVKAIKFLPLSTKSSSTSDEQFMVSGSDDNSLRLWSINNKTGSHETLQVLLDHQAPIHCIAVLKSCSYEKGVYLASGSADATIKVWRFEDRQLKLVQSIQTTPRYFPLALALSSLDESDGTLILAAAGTKTFIQVFVANVSNLGSPEFGLQTTLVGHEGWIRSLEFVREVDSDPCSDLLMSSASQDKYIRIWRVHQGVQTPTKPSSEADPSRQSLLPGKTPSNKAHVLKAGSKDFTITFEALLLGHEDWIYSAQWLSQPDQKPRLLSTSADNTLAMWEPDADSGIWISMVRLGEISREKGATTATGSTGGFWTGLWSPDGKSVVCLGRTGSWRRWKYNDSTDQWHQEIGISGHVNPVTGISWARSGAYIFSTSSDQTTRLHAPWKGAVGQNTWHEMARPQIHGYDLNCIDSLGDRQFVSGADEKLMRVFTEPKAVASLLNRLTGTEVASDAMPDSANMPVLGLSNKAIESGDIGEQQSEAPGIRKTALDLDHPPFEDSLSRYSLWPEAEKLYGHGYEISCLASSHDGNLIASACKATSTNHAVIRLFETGKWTEIRPPLMAHSLTAARVRFSPDDAMILSVGRDRQWAVFAKEAGETQMETEAKQEAEAHFSLKQANPKGHSRMILDAAWAQCLNPRGFATAGRDKKVHLWVEKNGAFELGHSLAFDSAVTAIDFSSQSHNAGKQILAVGTETGNISVCMLSFGETIEVVSNTALSPEFCLPKPVLQLAWRPVESSETPDEWPTSYLSVAGEDSSLRIYVLTKKEDL